MSFATGKPSRVALLLALGSLAAFGPACSDESPGRPGGHPIPPIEQTSHAIVPVLFATEGTPAPMTLDRFEAIWKATAARVVEETGLDLLLAPAVSHASRAPCDALGGDRQEILDSVTRELSQLSQGGARKLQVLLPCPDPDGVAAGVAYIGGAVALTFAPRSLGAGLSSGSASYISTVGVHELGHVLGLVHNSVGANCMGAFELLGFAETLLGSDAITDCVLLPHQRGQLVRDASPWLSQAVVGRIPAEVGPAVAALPTPPGATISLAWLDEAPEGASGVHVYRDGLRIGFVGALEPKSYVDTDGEAEYHDDPEMPDPGLRAGQRYCYRLAYVAPSGAEGPPGPESCATPVPL